MFKMAISLTLSCYYYLFISCVAVGFIIMAFCDQNDD